MEGILSKVRADRGLGRYRPKIVYVLSGGAAMGFCHLGMIEALERRGVHPDLVVGTSAGSLFGSLYCHFGNVDGVLRRVQHVFASDEFAEFERKYFGERKPSDGHVQSRLRHFFSGLTGTWKNGMRLGKAMVTTAMVAEKDAVSIFTRIFEGITFATLNVPFAAVAVDLVEGTPVIFSGPKGLMKAVMASSAIPLVFPAVVVGGHAHADGAIMSNFPSGKPGRSRARMRFLSDSMLPPRSDCPGTACRPWSSSSGSSSFPRGVNSTPTGSSWTSCFNRWTGRISGRHSPSTRCTSTWAGVI